MIWELTSQILAESSHSAIVLTLTHAESLTLYSSGFGDKLGCINGFKGCGRVSSITFSDRALLKIPYYAAIPNGSFHHTYLHDDAYDLAHLSMTKN